MRHILITFILAVGFFYTCLAESPLEQGFQNPPASAKARTWWHWLNGNVSKEGITADLEAMKKVGIQEAQLFNVKLGHPKGQASYLSPEWLEMFHFAATEAQRLGLELSFHNTAGWSSSGGPWITPELSMQKVVHSEVTLTGGATITTTLPQPETIRNHYRDIAILAFPKPQTRIPIDDLDIKILSERIRNHVAPDTKEVDPSARVASETIIDLTQSVTENGQLTWEAPDGEWTILRLGHTSTGKENHPAVDGGRGLECDKMNKKAVDAYWEGGIEPILTTLGSLVGTVVNNCLIDSYEVGTANWTPDFVEEFARLRGYDCFPYLPTLAGYYVDSGEISERFLWDFRRSIGDLMAENYYGHFRDLCHQNRLKFSVEPYWGPFDNLQVGATGDIVMCEFWSGELRFFDSAKFVASIANLKGSPIVAAEGFTGDGGWLQHPAVLKSIGDRAWAQGINRFIVHTYVHQPWDAPPGLNLGIFGIDFNRLNTWWEPGKAFLDYIARSQFLLQQGRAVADVLVFTGESSPNDGRTLPAIKEMGYDYDMIDSNSLNLLSVKEGQLLTPAGGSYRFLVLPDTPWMRPKTLKKFAALAEAGATILGPKPTHSPSLHRFPQSDAEVTEMAAKLWDSGLIKDEPILERLANDTVPPAFVMETGEREEIDFIHRRQGDTDLFFVANSSPEPRRFLARFRVADKQPELWNSQTGKIREAAIWQSHDDGTTSVALDFDSEESVFVIFRKTPSASNHLVAATVRSSGQTPSPFPDLEILKAEYGSFLQSGLVDVTAAVVTEVKDGKLHVDVGRQLSGSDPAPGYKKELRIKYSIGEEIHLASGVEKEAITIDPGDEGELKILRAVFGKFDISTVGVPAETSVIDVTKEVRAMVLESKKELPSASLRPTEASPGRLRVSYRSGGESHERTISANGTLKLAPPLPSSILAIENDRTIWLSPHVGELDYRNSAGKSDTLRVESVPESLNLTGEWEVRFPLGRGAPENATFDELRSWSDSDEKGIRHFSGTACYTKNFRLPERLTQPDIALELDLGNVRVMAEVVVNGTNLGVLWKKPFRIELRDTVKAGENQIEIHVTNLWPNRLIGDESLPMDYQRKGRNTSKWPQWLRNDTPRPSNRLTFTSHKFWDRDSPLQSSGLLGPVLIRPYVRTEIPF